MYTGQISRADLLQNLTAFDAVVYRMAMRLSGGQSTVHTLIAETVPSNRLGEAASFSHAYRDAQFVAGVTTGREIASWIASGAGAFHPDDATLVLRFQIPELTDATLQNRFPSHHFDGYVTIPWPYTRYDFNFMGHTYAQASTGLLIAEGCPFFPTFEAAVLALMYGIKDWQRVPSPSTDPRVIIRFANTDGMLDHVTIAPTSIRVRITGDRLHGSHLTISGPPTIEERQPVTGPGEHTFALAGEVPVPLWVVLARGDEWLDYYQRDTRWPLYSQDQSNVTIDPGDISTAIEAIISQGEGVTTEFKEAIPSPHEQMLKTVAAFANGEGGVILLGVKDRTGELVGVGSDTAALKDQVTNMIRSNIAPEPVIRFGEAVVDHRRLLAIYVEQGESPPYGLNPDPMKIRYYVRRGASTFPARPDQVRAIVLAREASRRNSHVPYLS